MNILTFDIEDWFHILDHPTTRGEKEWVSFESRIHQNMDTIHNIMEVSEVKATFFVMGWMAERYPDVVQKIAAYGYEIGSHTHMHQLAYEQDRQTFFKDVEKSIKTLEDCSGHKVTSFRAPGFSITEENVWAFEMLYELGINTDSSVFPVGRAHGGFPSYNTSLPSVLNYNGISIREFPINTHEMLGKSLIFSGGGYFRLLPYTMIKSWTRQSNYVMSYFHPRDFDPHQPFVPGLGPLRKFKSYVGLKTAKQKLEKWLSDFEFTDIATASGRIDWSNVEQIDL